MAEAAARREPTMNHPARQMPNRFGPQVARWLYTQHGEAYGPVSAVELWAAALLGFVGPNDLVRRKDMGTWIRAASVNGLFSERR